MAARGGCRSRTSFAYLGVVSLPSGVLYKVLQSGSGTTSPTLSDKVRVHYAGTLINGKEFDSSYGRGSPAEFGVSGVIKGSETRAQRDGERERGRKGWQKGRERQREEE